jgi:hypothetical protein
MRDDPAHGRPLARGARSMPGRHRRKTTAAYSDAADLK